MDYTHQFFTQHEDPMLDMYTQSQFQAPLTGFHEESYGPGLEQIPDLDIISTIPMQRAVVPSLEEAAESEDTSTRPRLTHEQIAVLEDNFKSKPKPGTDFKKQLANRIGLSLQRVNNWYQNRRAKARHQRPQERRFDVLTNDTSGLWPSVDFGFPEYTNGVLDLSPQISNPPMIDGICIPSSEDGGDRRSNFHTELDVFHGYLNSAATDSDFSPEGDVASSLPFSDGSTLAMIKTASSELPDWNLQDWSPQNQGRSQFTDEGLAALEASQAPIPQTMCHNSLEGYHHGNLSCQTFATASSSDGEQPSLMTPPPRTSPLPFAPPDHYARRGSSTADLASDLNTIHLKHSQSSMGFSHERSEVTAASVSHTPDGTPPAPPHLQTDAEMTHPEPFPTSATNGSTTPRLDLASRRKRPRPAALRPDAQRSVSYGPMTLSPTARMPSLGTSTTASVRRIKSTGNGLNAGNGRIQKPGLASGPISPRNFHHLSSNDFLASTTHVTATSTRNITPLTPLSPVKTDQQDQPWSGHWFNAQDHEAPTVPDHEAHITSPPITPYQTGFQPSFAHAGPQAAYQWPPQSAPPQQTTFFDSPPMPPAGSNHLSWRTPPSISLHGYNGAATQQVVRPPMIPPPMDPQCGYLELQPLPSQRHHMYQQMSFFQPPFLESSPPQKEIEIQVQVIPAPEGISQGRKTYTFNHTTPRDFSNAEGSKVVGTTDPNPT
ncbi:MAG: hypothetical protein LQ346_001845 [Caloplaca aetnensis]|nr:MAG: hypothetical protein LQ346_001845 [Caloplaca aetnensis]